MATEILRPNEAGDYTDIASQWPEEGEHWDKIDEIDADNGTTQVRTYSVAQQKDAYNLQPSEIAPGSTINSLKVYFKWSTSSDTKTGYLQPFLRLGENETAGTNVERQGVAYVFDSEILSRPGGGEWDVTDLADLQVAIGMAEDGAWYCRCTQVYVVVDYEPAAVAAGGAGGLAAAAKVLLT